jgi:hypothetical protein
MSEQTKREFLDSCYSFCSKGSRFSRVLCLHLYFKGNDVWDVDMSYANQLLELSKEVSAKLVEGDDRLSELSLTSKQLLADTMVKKLDDISNKLLNLTAQSDEEAEDERADLQSGEWYFSYALKQVSG